MEHEGCTARPCVVLCCLGYVCVINVIRKGRIVFITKEEFPPYDRPVLSKNLYADIDHIQLRKADFFGRYRYTHTHTHTYVSYVAAAMQCNLPSGAFLRVCVDKLEIESKFKTTVTKLDAKNSTLHFDDGSTMKYDKARLQPNQHTSHTDPQTDRQTDRPTHRHTHHTHPIYRVD